MDILRSNKAKAAVETRWSKSRATATGHENIHKHGNGFRVRIRVHGRLLNIGTRATLSEAVRLRDAAVARYKGAA